MTKLMESTLELLVVVDLLMAFGVLILSIVCYAFVRALEKMPAIIAEQVRRANSRRSSRRTNSKRRGGK